jgi:hypothetical protein
MLESIPSDIITKAAAMLPDAKSAPDEPHNVAMLQRSTDTHYLQAVRVHAKQRSGFGQPQAPRPYRQNNGTRQDARGLFSGLTTNARGDQCAARAAAPLHPWARKMADPAGLLRENTADQLLHTEKGLVDVTPVGQALWRRPMPRTRRKAPESECSSLRCLTRLLRRACARALPTSAMSNQEPPNRVWTTGRAWAPIKAIKG